MTMYNIELELDERNIDADRGNEIMESLTGYHPAVGPGLRGQASVTISLPAENLTQAFNTGIAVVERATGSTAVVAEVMTSDEFDIRNGLEPVPELMSVTEIANEYGMSRQAILKMIDTGRLASATKVGDSWAVPTSEVMMKKPRTADEATAALARGAASKKTIPHGPRVG